MSNAEVQLFFERYEDVFSSGGEEVVGDLVGESVGLFSGACDLAPDEIGAIQTRYKCGDFYIISGNLCKGPYRGVTTALHCRQNLSFR
jgi:hypothetical protein